MRIRRVDPAIRVLFRFPQRPPFHVVHDVKIPLHHKVVRDVPKRRSNKQHNKHRDAIIVRVWHKEHRVFKPRLHKIRVLPNKHKIRLTPFLIVSHGRNQP